MRTKFYSIFVINNTVRKLYMVGLADLFHLWKQHCHKIFITLIDTTQTVL